MRHRGLQHGCGIGEPRRLQNDAAKDRAAVVEVAQQLFERVDEVAAQGAAQATALQQYDAVADRFDQQMVEADFAEFVDDHRGFGERRVAEQAVEQGGLASAEEAGEHRQGNGVRRAQRARRVGHFACELWSAGVTTMGGGCGAGFLGFGFGAVPSPDAAAVADPPSLAASLRALGFAFGAASSADDAAAVDDTPSLPSSLAASFAAGDLGLAATFFFSGFDSVAACAPGAGGLVPV